jgi:hypothetical protein
MCNKPTSGASQHISSIPSPDCDARRSFSGPTVTVMTEILAPHGYTLQFLLAVITRRNDEKQNP